MDWLCGSRMVAQCVGGCQFDSHGRLWWRRAVVATDILFPCPVELITDFIASYNIYNNIRTERNF